MNLDKLLEWSKREFHYLPWRSERTLYRTLVSEIMLQQTTVSTVLNHFERFLEEFPTLSHLAQASEEELLIAWKGLGYYRRAKNLKKIAEHITEKFNSEIPDDYQTLISIPGIGPYTANALIAIGKNQKALAIDANLERVISRLFALKEAKGIKLQNKINELFNQNKIFKDVKSYRALNEALMDLGRTHCQARRVSCELCLLKTHCQALKEKKVLSYPVDLKEKKASVEHELKLLRLVIARKNQILVYKKNEKEWLAGQYELPTFITETTDEKLDQYPRIEFDTSDLPSVKTSITKYKITNFALKLNLTQLKSMKFPREVMWIDFDEKSNISTASKKILSL
ncbi:MAG: A/G-specific adenine glycosylase [Bacteriovoracaceae bacterium]